MQCSCPCPVLYPLHLFVISQTRLAANCNQYLKLKKKHIYNHTVPEYEENHFLLIVGGIVEVAIKPTHPEGRWSVITKMSMGTSSGATLAVLIFHDQGSI